MNAVYFFSRAFNLSKCINFKSKQFHYLIKYFAKQLDNINVVNLNYCKLIEWNNIKNKLLKFKNLTNLSIIQINLNVDHLYDILNQLNCLRTLEFTQPTNGDGNRLGKLNNLKNLNYLCIDFIRGGSILQVLVSNCASLETLIIISVKKITCYQPYKLSLPSSHRLKTLIIKNTNVTLKPHGNGKAYFNSLIERLTSFRINFECSQFNASNLELPLGNSLVKQFRFYIYSLNHSVQNYTGDTETLNVDLNFISKTTQLNLLKINSRSYAISPIVYDLSSLTNCHYLSVLDLKSVHIHIRSSLCEILFQLKG